MSEQMNQQDWEQIDSDLFSNNVLSALKLVRNVTKCPLKTAIDIVHQRFDELAAECPERFHCDLKTYWDGYYS